MVSSIDGFCTIVTINKEELGKPYHPPTSEPGQVISEPTAGTTTDKETKVQQHPSDSHVLVKQAPCTDTNTSDVSATTDKSSNLPSKYERLRDTQSKIPVSLSKDNTERMDTD